MSNEKLLISSTDLIQGYEVVNYIGVETSEVVVGTGPISEMFSKMADVMGVRSSSFETKLDKGRRAAFDILEKKALKQGANGLIGLDIDLLSYDKNRSGIVVTATLVQVVRVPSIHKMLTAILESTEKFSSLDFSAFNTSVSSNQDTHTKPDPEPDYQVVLDDTINTSPIAPAKSTVGKPLSVDLSVSNKADEEGQSDELEKETGNVSPLSGSAFLNS